MDGIAPDRRGEHGTGEIRSRADPGRAKPQFTWIGLRVGRKFPEVVDWQAIAHDQHERLLDGKPVVLAVVRGGAYGPGTPRDGWDHSTGYLRRIFADVWGADLTMVEREFTLVGVNPALDQFTDLAAQLKDTAHSAAKDAGRALAAAQEPAPAG